MSAVMDLLGAKLNRSIRGSLVFSDDQLPDTDRKIHFFIKGFFGSTYLGYVQTDPGGGFVFRYNWEPVNCCQRTYQLFMEVREEILPFANHGFCCAEEVVIGHFQRDLKACVDENDLGRMELNHIPISPNLTSVAQPAPNHRQSAGYFWRLAKAVVPEQAKNLLVKLSQKCLSITAVQSLYDCCGPRYPKQPATPERLISELLNEICAVDYEIEGPRVRWRTHWQPGAFAGDQSMPNVTVTAIKNGNDLALESIEIVSHAGDVPDVVLPDSPNLERAIFVARSVFALRGEAETHLAEGHLLPGLVGKAFFKHIKPENPIYSMASAHLCQIDFINWLGSQGIIFGKGSVLQTSSLTDAGISALIINQMKKKADYTRDLPLDPLCPEHHRARVGKIHYEILEQFFRNKVLAHLGEIRARRNEIYHWSACMHRYLPEIPRIMEAEGLFEANEQERLIRCLAWVVHKTTFHHFSIHTGQGLLTDVSQASLSLGRNALMASQQIATARELMDFKTDSLMQNPNGDVDLDLIRAIKLRVNYYLPYRADQISVTTQI